ncbi:MAG: multiheme c-type cytochrome [Planctomycetota bacterium]
MARKNRLALLSPFQRGLLLVVAILAVYLLANSLYLLGYTWLQDLRELRGRNVKSHQSMLYSHFQVGRLFGSLALLFVVLHLTRIRRHFHKSAVLTGLLALVGLAVLWITGEFMLEQSSGGEKRWVFHAHRIAGAVALLAYLGHRYLSWFPTPKPVRRRYAGVIVGLALVMAAVHFFEQQSSEPPIIVYDKAYEPIDISSDPFIPFVPLGDFDPHATFFPSGATLASGEKLKPEVIMPGPLPDPKVLEAEFAQKGFTSSASIGAEDCRLCHEDSVRQWEGSAHRFSSFNNPFYTASVLATREQASPEIAQFCGGCHDPAVMLAGNFLEEIDRDSVPAQAGLTCTVCHIVNRIHNVTGNGNYELADNGEDPYLFAGATSGWKLEARKYLIKARPRDHKDFFRKPFYSEPEYCAACHKVNLDVPVNGYKWLRGQDEYDNWHDSGVSRNAARTFYLPPSAKVCQDCHMPSMEVTHGDLAAKGGVIKGHEFLAVNTALPHVRGDQERLDKVEKFMKDGKLRVGIFAMEHPREGLIMDFQNHPVEIRPGDELVFHVVVRNMGVGHTFPGGTNDSNQGWLQFEVKDQDGKEIKRSGFLDEKKFLDRDAHQYMAVMLGKDGEPAMERDAHTFHVAGLVRVIPPGNVDIGRFRVTVPKGDSLEIDARLLWRKFNRYYTEYSYGFLGLEPPDLPITEIAADHFVLPIGPAPSAPAANAPWIHYNDYGIGSMRQGDLKTALAAFTRVAEIEPDRVDGFRNQARVHLVEGDPEPARELLARCEEIVPGDAQTKLWWAEYLKLEGELELSAQMYEGVLESFPKDRDTWRRLADVRYRLDHYDRSLDAALHALQIDPEDVASHYQRMLIYRAQGESDKEEHARAAFEKYRIDDSAPQIIKGWRLKDPVANREIEPLHVH